MSKAPTPFNSKEAELFRYEGSQAVRIPVEFELPADRVLIRREGDKIIIEPAIKPLNIVELLAEWKREGPLGPDDQFPVIDDMPAKRGDFFERMPVWPSRSSQ